MQEFSVLCSYMHECARNTRERIARQGADGRDLTQRRQDVKGLRGLGRTGFEKSGRLWESVRWATARQDYGVRSSQTIRPTSSA